MTDNGKGKRKTARKLFGVWLLAGLLLLMLTNAKADGTLNAWEQVKARFSEAVQRGEREMTFTLSPSLLSAVREDNSRMWYWAARGGVKDCAWSWRSNGQITVTKMEAFDCPWAEVSGEAALIAALGDMRAQGAERFVLLAEEALYNTLKNDGAAERALLLEGGLERYGTVYSRDGVCFREYTGCRFWDGGFARAGSEAEVLQAMERFGEEGKDAFALSLDEAVWQRLTAGEMERLHTLEALANVEGEMTYSEEDCLMIFQREGGSVFYPGYRILRAVLGGTEAQLPARLRETLDRARTMVSGIDGTQEEMALAIHDLLCAHVTYTVDESTDEDDRCVGAILNGQANCDGYADAYLLLCGLKGIPVRLWHGDDLNWDDPLDDETHLWNLVLLDGVWRSVDVTWDDDDDGETGWVFWNIGTDRMREHYTFEADLLPENMLAVTDLKDRPMPEFEVSDAQEAIAAVREAAERGAKGLVLWMSEALFREYQSESSPVWSWLDLGGAAESSVTYSERDRRAQIRVTAWSAGEKETAEAETEEQVMQILRRAVQSGAKEISLYLGEELYARYRGEASPIWKWLDLAGILDASVSHIDARRQVLLEEIVYNDGSVAAAEVRTGEELIAALRSAAGAAEIRLYLGEELYALYQSEEAPIWKWLDLGGIRDASVRYSDAQRRILLDGILYNDGSVAAAEVRTEEELIAALRSAARSGAGEIRLYLGEELYARFRQKGTIVWTWLDKGGFRDASVQYSDQGRRIVYKDLVR